MPKWVDLAQAGWRLWRLLDWRPIREQAETPLRVELLGSGAAAERAVLERALRRSGREDGQGSRDEITPGLFLEVRRGRAVVTGAKVDASFLDALRAWLGSR